MGSSCSNDEDTLNDDEALEDAIDYTIDTAWSQNRSHKSSVIRNSPFAIGHLIYYLTDHGVGESGIVIYNSKTDKFVAKIPYHDKQWKPSFHSYVYHDNKIYCLGGEWKSILIYDLKTNEASSIPTQKEIRLGKFTTSVMVHGNIHILGGIHRMYEIIKDEMYLPSDNLSDAFEQSEWQKSPNVHNPCILYIQKLNKLLFFGGYGNYKACDEFYCSSVVIDDNYIKLVRSTLLDIQYPFDVMNIIMEYMIDSNNNQLNIMWRKIDNAKLPIPLSRCGYILHNDIIFTFGGYTNHEYIQEIYCLDVCNINNGWKVVENVTVPLKACYHAVLVENKMIHLWSRSNNLERPQHFVISIKEIVHAPRKNLAQSTTIDSTSNVNHNQLTAVQVL